MIRKAMTAIIIALLPFALHASYVGQLSKPLHIQAAYEAVAFIDVEEIPAQSQAYLQGMPFNIEESYVQADTTEDGRLIANWSMISNQDVKIRITAEPMHHATKNSLYLPYRLLFTYLFGYADEKGNMHTAPGTEFEVFASNAPTSDTNSANTSIFHPLSSISFGTGGDDNDTYVGSVDGEIYFQFTDWSTERILAEENYGKDATNLPSGNYTAQVTIELIPVE